MTILQQPDSLSLSGNIKEFRIGTTDTISFLLLQEGEEVVSRSYEPGADGVVIINIRDIVHGRLSFLFKNTSLIYEQVRLVSVFKAVISNIEVEFRVIRAGVDMFADSATNFLTQNFLTWQPNVKPVTYYSPEFLTYYATLDCTVKLRAYFTDKSGTVISQSDIELAGLTNGKAYTIPLQYASVVERLGNRMPAYYDVWIENMQTERLTYIQRYYASDIKSETEQWVLFENSLGGIDTFRAYGSTNFTGEHTHNIAEIDDTSLEYRVDTAWKFQKNTGYLDRKERSWLLDFFPSLKKYLYIGSFLRPIIVIESNVTYTDKELPSNYTFAYKYADAKPFLNLPRTDIPADILEIKVPEVGSFTVPPRLVEFPRLPLSEGAQFPVQDPYSERWGVTTTGSISNYIINHISENYGGGGGIGHYHENIDLLNLLSYAAGYLLIAGKKARVGYADETLSFVNDIAQKLIRFEKGLQSDNIETNNYISGISGRGACLKIDPETEKSVFEVDNAIFREGLIIPKITFNCVDVISGDKANTFAFGTIKNVDQDKCIAELDLLEGQLATIQVSDIIRGIFHNIEGNNTPEDSYDETGFLNYTGFSTSYFTPIAFTANWEGECIFSYALKPGTNVHPMKGMNFYAYGNFNDKQRQSITYENRYYTRRLKNVNTWAINPERNIAMQDGLLDGLTIGGMKMSGYGRYDENSYFTGVHIQFTPEQKEELKGQDAYSVSLSTYEAIVLIDDAGELVGGMSEERFVASGDDLIVAEDGFIVAKPPRFSTRVQVFRGTKELFYSVKYQEDSYMVSLNAVGCIASIDCGVVSVTGITDFEHCYIDISVNCEGNCVFEKQFKVTAIRNGVSAVVADLDNEMDSVACDPEGKVLFGLPVCTNVSMWYGNESIIPSSIALSLPDGVTGFVNNQTITITGISKEADTNLGIGVTVLGSYSGIQYKRTLSFVIHKVVPGENAVIYSLFPSVSSIKVDKVGIYSVSEISCAVTMTDGKTVNAPDSLPSFVSMKYSIDDAAPVNYLYKSNIALKNCKKSILFSLYLNDILVDREVIPVVFDGTDGADGVSAVVADLDNEMDSVACDAQGNVLFGLPVSSNVSMWCGNAPVRIDKITLSLPDGVTGTVNNQTITVTGISKEAVANLNVGVTVLGTYNKTQYQRHLSFVIHKVIPGENAVIYSLQPTENGIKVDKNGIYSVDRIACAITMTDGKNVSVLDALPASVSMKYSLDDMALKDYVYKNSLSLKDCNNNVAFHLYHNGTLVDREVIPIIFDGTDGADGISSVAADLDNEMDSVACDPEGNVLFGLPVNTNVAMWYGDKPAHIDEIILSLPPGVTGGVKDKVVSITGISKDANINLNIGITVMGTYKGLQYTRNLPFIIHKVIPGENAVIYSLSPSSNSIKVDKAGIYSVSEISCAVTMTDGKTVNVPDSLPSSVSMKYSIDDVAPVDYVYKNNVSLKNSRKNISFYLYRNGILIDREVIPVVFDGTDGKGDDGNDGASGAIYRRWKGYTVGKIYRNDEGVTNNMLLEEDNVRYIDVVLIENKVMDTGYECYIARKFNGQNSWTGTDQTSPVNETFVGNESSHWRKANNMTSIFTDLIIAKNAVIDFFQGNRIQIMNDDGTISCVIGGGDYPILVGDNDSDNAVTSIDRYGKFKSRDVEVEGVISARLIYTNFKHIIFNKGDNLFDPILMGSNISLGADNQDATIILPPPQNFSGLKLSFLFRRYAIRIPMLFIIKTDVSFDYDNYNWRYPKKTYEVPHGMTDIISVGDAWFIINADESKLSE